MPQEYYEAYQLEEKVTKPCQVNGFDSLCNQFSFLGTKKPGLFSTELETGYIIERSGRLDTQLFKNESVLRQLVFSAMALLDSNQVKYNTFERSGTLRNYDGDGNGNVKKTIRFNEQNNNSPRAALFSLNFFAVPEQLPLKMTTF